MKLELGKSIAVIETGKALYITTKAQIESFTVNWKHNRPADQVRIQDITAHYNDMKKSWIDHIVYTWRSGDRLHVYDGWNRYLAATPDMNLILSVFETTDEAQVIADFKILNKSVPIPDIYDGTINRRKELISTVCERFDEMYGIFKKPSKNPRCPHYNRDLLMQLLGTLPIDFDTMTPEKMMDAIMKTNNELSRYPINVPMKAKEHNFYLFATKTVNLTQIITKNLTEETTIGNKIMNLFR